MTIFDILPKIVITEGTDNGKTVRTMEYETRNTRNALEITEEFAIELMKLQTQCQNRNNDIITRGFTIGDKVMAWKCKNGEPIDDFPIQTVIVESFSDVENITDLNAPFFKSGNFEYLFYAPTKD